MFFIFSNIIGSLDYAYILRSLGLEDILLIVLLIVCTISDIWKRKIYNAVLVPFILLGIALAIYQDGWMGLFQSTSGFLLGMFLLIIPFIQGGIGGGDVKFLAAIGVIKGYKFVFFSFLSAALFGGLMALLILMWQRRLFSRLAMILRSLYYLLISRFKIKTLEIDKSHTNNHFPYGVAIALGALSILIINSFYYPILNIVP